MLSPPFKKGESYKTLQHSREYRDKLSVITGHAISPLKDSLIRKGEFNEQEYCVLCGRYVGRPQ